MDLIEQAERAVLTEIFRHFPLSFVWIGGSLLQLVHHSPRASLDVDLAPAEDSPSAAELRAVVKESIERVNGIVSSAFRIQGTAESHAGFLRIRIEESTGNAAFTVDVTRIAGTVRETRAVLLQSVLGTASVRIPADSAILGQKLRALLLRRFVKPGDLFDAWFLLKKGVRLGRSERLALRDELGGENLDWHAIQERLRVRKDWPRALTRSGVSGLDEQTAEELPRTVLAYIKKVMK